jgi:glycosyltransferase involved in cell wall biosynthesis
LRPADHFDVHVPPAALKQAKEALAGSPNLQIVPCAIEPFSLREQLTLEKFARGDDLAWFTNYWVPLGWSGRYVATVHDLLHLEPRYFTGSVLRRGLSRLTFRKLLNADGLIFISRFTEYRYGRLIGTPRRSVVAHNGIDHAGWMAGGEGLPRTRQQQMLMVGAAKRHKNFATVLAAWGKAELPAGWRLVIVSPDAKFRSSVEIAEGLVRSENVDIRRNATDTELKQLYHGSAIVLAPSLYEGFGLPLLEGLRAGALCISSSAEASVEIADGANVRFVDGLDVDGWAVSLREMAALHDGGGAKLERMRQENARHADQFRWDDTALKTSDLLSTVMD